MLSISSYCSYCFYYQHYHFCYHLTASAVTTAYHDYFCYFWAVPGAGTVATSTSRIMAVTTVPLALARHCIHILKMESSQHGKYSFPKVKIRVSEARALSGVMQLVG